MPAKLVPGLCAKLGLPLPQRDDAGQYALALPDGYTVVISGGRDTLEFKGALPDLPASPGSEDEAANLCRELPPVSLGCAAQR